MKCFFDFFESIDPFGVTINFNYKGSEMYKSSLGGLVFFAYSILSCIYVTITFIFFFNRSTKTVYNYSKEHTQTGNFSFQNYSVGISVGFTCDDYNNKYGNLTDIFNVKASLIRFIRENGKKTKYKTVIQTHRCTNEDFYNELNDSVSSNGLKNEGFYCPDKGNYVVGGIISDNDYSYYEIYVESNYDEIGDNYTELLYEFDCKLSVYFTDVLIDVSNVENPVSKYINSKFLQLSPLDYKKFNLFFSIKRFLSDENWFITYPKETVFLGYSRSDEYAAGKGEDRYVKHYEDYKKYGKFFIRIDTNEYITDRRYEKFTEFFSNSTSLISGIFLLLDITFKYINNLYCLGSIFERSFLTGKEGLERRKRFGNIFTNKIQDPLVTDYIETIKSSKYMPNVNVINLNEIVDRSSKNLNTIEKLNKENLGTVSNINVDSYEKINNLSIHFEDSLKKNLKYKINNYLENEDKKTDNKSVNIIQQNKKNNNKIFEPNSSGKMPKPILRKRLALNKSIDSDRNKNNSNINNYSSNTILHFDDKVKMRIQHQRTFVKNNYNVFNFQVDAKKIAYYLGFYGCLFCVKKTTCNDQESREIKEVLESFLELLDINNYLKMNKDIELIKYLLISQDEDILMGFLERPSIPRKKANLFKMMTNINKDIKEKKKTEEFWKKFSNLLYQKDKSEFEKKLCYLVCSEINDLIAIKK